MKSPDGSWSGLAVDVWAGVAKKAGLDYELVEVPYEDIRHRVAEGSLDAAVGEIAVSAEDEKILDFTQPYLISSIGVALHGRHWQAAWIEAIREFFNWNVARFLAGVLVAMLLVSVIIWLLERRHHAGHFRGGIHGIGSALWFSAVTMTTVGYGDKTPATALGRFVAICWMFVGVLLVSAFTAIVTSSMSASRINNSINRISDFQHLDCGILKNSEAQAMAEQFGMHVTGFESLEEALRQLADQRIQAVIADKISLGYLQRQMAREKPPVRFEVPVFSIRSSFIAIPVRNGHPDYDRINQSLLMLTASPEWEQIRKRWIGFDTEGI